MLVMSNTVSSPNDTGANSQKYVVPRCSPFPSPVKRQFAGHVNGCLCKRLDGVFRCEDFTFHFTSYFVQM